MEYSDSLPYKIKRNKNKTYTDRNMFSNIHEIFKVLEKQNNTPQKKRITIL